MALSQGIFHRIEQDRSMKNGIGIQVVELDSIVKTEDLRRNQKSVGLILA